MKNWLWIAILVFLFAVAGLVGILLGHNQARYAAQIQVAQIREEKDLYKRQAENLFFVIDDLSKRFGTKDPALTIVAHDYLYDEIIITFDDENPQTPFMSYSIKGKELTVEKHLKRPQKTLIDRKVY